MLRIFSYSFTASDGSQESTAGRVISPCSIVMHHGFRSKEAMRARKQEYRLCQTTSHSSLLAARQGDLSRKLNQSFLLVESFNFNLVDDERPDKYTKFMYGRNPRKIHLSTRELCMERTSRINPLIANNLRHCKCKERNCC